MRNYIESLIYRRKIMALNPWKVEVFQSLRERVILDIVHEKTGELRRVELGVDDLNNILMIGTKRIETTAEILRDDTENTVHLEDIIGTSEES
jgi:hypothetical protein